MKATKQSDETQIALMGKDISQIQKDVSSALIKLEEIKNTRYVTQNEMQMAIKEARDDMLKDIGAVTERLANIQKILWLILSTALVAIIGSILKLVLKV